MTNHPTMYVPKAKFTYFTYGSISTLRMTHQVSMTIFFLVFCQLARNEEKHYHGKTDKLSVKCLQIRILVRQGNSTLVLWGIILLRFWLEDTHYTMRWPGWCCQIPRLPSARCSKRALSFKCQDVHKSCK